MAAAAPPTRPNSVIGIDVGGTNTDAVILQGDDVLAWHKTPTTADIQHGVELAIEQVMQKANLPGGQVDSQFVNAVLEEDSSKLDKVAVIRLCGPYTRGSPPFVDFPPTLRKLVEGYFGYVDGGYQVDGVPISDLNVKQLQEQAAIIKARSITSIVVIGVYSPSNPRQEDEAKDILAAALGPDFDICCSYDIGRLGFIERENATILNASLRRFARHVIAGFSYAVQKVGKCNLYITLNDGTLSKASAAAQYPVKCFRSGPTNSARGAALLGKAVLEESDDREVLVIDVGGTTTDICALLKTGYPRQSSAFVKIAGVRTNFTLPDVHSIALGGGSIVRQASRTLVGPDSVGAQLEVESVCFGGSTVTATDLVQAKDEALVPEAVKASGLKECLRILEEAIDIVKTKKGDAKVILVGGGSIIIGDHINGVGQVIRPNYFAVANAVGAAIGKISGAIEKMFIPGVRSLDEEIEDAKVLATEKCVTAGGKRGTIEVVEVEAVPISYVTNGATQLYVRVIGDLAEDYEEIREPAEIPPRGEALLKSDLVSTIPNSLTDTHKGSSYDITENIDLKYYRPRIEGDLWYLSEIDIQFLSDGTGILGVGSCGEPYPTYLALLQVLRNGGDLTIRRQDTFPDDGVVLVAGYMGAPSVYTERIPGLNDVTDAMKALLKTAGLETFDAVIPNEIGGLNAFEALLAAHRFGKSALDTDLVARAYPMIYQTVRCLNGVPVTPAALADGAGNEETFPDQLDNLTAEEVMRSAAVRLGSLAGVCINPILGTEAKTLPPNSFSFAWTIGRSIALSRSLKLDPITTLLASHSGVLLFTGKITSVNRYVAKGFTRGNVLLDEISREDPSNIADRAQEAGEPRRALVEFENENLNVVLKEKGKEDRLVAICPDLITFLDLANGAPLGVADYKYGMRISIIALRSPPEWLTGKGLEVGGPRAFGLDIDYKAVSSHGEYGPPKSVWETYGAS
ncbi:hypothetical protein OIDMADRAFT_176029 [Oidiodendron maius Zn]|uniref:Hydantoinase/oxoprolinase N-terminal domain-containing protein n=1 Tax=Oidiodendron maius (strain Zn) TaxID=913774 RepID=A0A0C3DUW4_OIDMZ|nr:hypothetical protein OIDMADRAFT_176029 [Oidiodendron maius Zn]